MKKIDISSARVDVEDEVSDLLLKIMYARKAKAARQQRASMAVQTKDLSKNMIGGVIGNILEWYDFAVFGFFAPVIGEQFFPSNDPVDSLLGAFSVFAAAFLVRPLGGMFFGYIGDQFGRKKALQLSVMMMAIPTFLIGLLPTHSQIGILAPICLILLRVAQGLSVGGELIGSIAFVAETAPAKERGFFSSWTFASCYTGIMLGSLSAVFLNNVIAPEDMASWGWRLPFLAGIVIGVAGLWMRKELSETPIFEKMKKERRIRRNGINTPSENPLTEAIHLAPGGILHALALVVLVGGGFYILFVWWPTLLTRFIHPHVPNAMLLNTISMLVLITLIPITGRLSDKLGRKHLLVLGAACMTLGSLPLFMLASMGTVETALIAQVFFAVFLSIFLGPVPATLVEMFPARVRYSAIGLGYNISLCIFGGSAPLVATWLMSHFQNVAAPGIYLTFLSAISLWAATKLDR